MEGRHDQHIGGAGQAAERIELAHQLEIQRHIGLHLAVIFEIDLARSSIAHRVADALACARSGGLPKVEKESSATRGSWPSWRATSAACDGDVGELLGRGQFVHGGIGDQHGAALGDDDREAEQAAGRAGDRAPAGCPRSVVEKLRVTPVTMASASPSATMQAAKTLRSWLTMRWQSR